MNWGLRIGKKMISKVHKEIKFELKGLKPRLSLSSTLAVVAVVAVVPPFCEIENSSL